MTTRNGKIAKLPLQLRDELNSRLFEGEPANQLIDWLNTQPAVIEVLAANFEGRLISEQNISEWRQGGYVDWLAIHTSLNGARSLLEEAAQIEATGITSERLLKVLMVRQVEMVKLIDMSHEDLFLRRLAALERLTNCALAIRKSEIQTARLQLERERLELLREKQRGSSKSSSGENAPRSNREYGGQCASPVADGPQSVTDSSPVSGNPDDLSTSPQNLDSPASDSLSAEQSAPGAATRTENGSMGTGDPIRTPSNSY